MYSTTKYFGGHGTSIGGVVIDGGNFDWEAHPTRQPALNTPDPSYHGAVWSQAVKPLGPIAYILKMRVTLLRDLGAAMTHPFNAFLFLQGVETLALRMKAHSENTLGGGEISRGPKGRRARDPSVAATPAWEQNGPRRGLPDEGHGRPVRLRTRRWRRCGPQVH